jgi:3,4-dihydroxy 2-butanone 4-phosphate synthase/GTP cyclohydrolase II
LQNKGVLRRTGHTEAANIDFTLAGFKSAGVIVEIMNEDGTWLLTTIGKI